VIAIGELPDAGCHPHVAGVQDVHAGWHWLVMDYHRGASLAEVLRGGRRRLPASVAAALGLQLLAALRAVHAAGVVHCDVKLANLLLGEDGRLVLVDFGIAETVGQDPVHPARRTGHVVGSPAYMAPELVRGEAPRPPADLWWPVRRAG
jgi:eukaryotic-like serine/threonine-protein kinase